MTHIVRALVFAVPLVLVGCHNPPPERTLVTPVLGTPPALPIEEEAGCPDELNDIILKKVSKAIYGGDFEDTLPKIERHQETIVCIRDWVKASVKDPCENEAYNRWLAAIESNLGTTKARLIAAKGAPIKSEWEIDQEKKERRILEYARTHPIPDPPRCDLDVVRRAR